MTTATDKARADKMEKFLDELALVVDGDPAAVARHADFLADDDAAADLRHEAMRTKRRLEEAGVDYVPPSDLDARVLAALDARGTERTTQPGGLLGGDAVANAANSAPTKVSGTAPTVSMEMMVGASAMDPAMGEVPETPSKGTSNASQHEESPRPHLARSAHEENFESPPGSNVVSIDKARARRRALVTGFGVLTAITATALAGAAAIALWPSTDATRPETTLVASNGLTARVTRIVRAAGGEAGTGIEVRPAGGSFAVGAVDANLAAGATLRTDERTRAEITLSDGTQVVLNHGTELTLDASAPRLMRLAEGEILADVEHLESGPNCTIQTPTGAIEVLGTRFVVTATSDMTSVRVTRGKVSLSSSDGRRADVDIGEEGVVHAGGAPTVVPSIDLARAVGWASELQNEDGAESTSEETIAGIGSLRARRPGEREDHERPMTIASHHISVRIVGNVARTEVEEVFRNDSDQELEGIYRFPMPPGAHIARLGLDIDGRMEEAAFVPRERASRIWRGVIRNATAPAARNPNEEFIWVSGPWRDPALLEWQRGGSFELRIFPIPAHGERRVAIAYTETIAPSAEGRRYVYPMAHSRDDSTRIGEMNIDVRVAGAANVTARGYSVTSAAEGDATRLSYNARDFRPNGDLVIDYALPAGEREVSFWTYAGSEATTAPPDRSRERDDEVAAAHRAVVADARGYVAFALRPTLPARTEGRSRDYVIVVDSSQSMVGERWDRASHLVAGVISELDRRDRFTVMACDLTCRSVDGGGASTRAFRTPTSAEVRAVTAWLGTIEPAGASDLGATLRRATELPASSGPPREVHVVYVGDGVASVGHRAAGTLGEIAAEVARTRSVSITTVGIGQDADTVALSAIARAGGGHYVPYVPGQRTSAAALAVLETTYGVSLEGTEISLPAGLSDRAPSALPTLRAGEEMVVVARMDQPTVTGDIVLRGTVGGAPFEQRYPVRLEATSAAGNLFVPQLWASGTIERLELEGRGEDVPRIVALSRAYRVMSRHTSLLVLESEAMFRAFGIDHGEAGATWTGEEDVVGGGADGSVAVADEVALLGALGGAAEASDSLAGGDMGGGSGSGVGSGYGRSRSAGGAGGAVPAAPARELDDRADRDTSRRSAADAAAEPNAAPATSASRAPMGGGLRGGPGVGSGTWMRRVYYRVGDISTEGAPTFNETEAARRAEEALRGSPDSRDRHRTAVRALARAGNLERALEVAESWFSRDRLDPEALAARADLTARLGREDEALRLLSGTVDLRPDDATLQERLASAYDRAGETERACAHRISLAEIDPSSADRVGAAMRCERAAGHPTLAEALLRSVREDRVRSRALTAAAADAPELRTRGDLTVDATWSGGDDISVALISPDGTRISWMGGRTTVVGRDARASGRELVGLSRATVGTYIVEISRTGSDGTEHAITGDLRIRALDENQTVHFTLPAGEAHRAIARASVRRESRLESVSGGGW